MGVFANYADLSWEDVDRQFRLNLLAPARLIHASLSTMLERGGGQIVNVLSMAAIHILPGANAYSASKAALLTLAKTISQEYRSQGSPGHQPPPRRNRHLDLGRDLPWNPANPK